MNRRQFISACAAAGAGVSFGSACFAGRSSHDNSLRDAGVSDLSAGKRIKPSVKYEWSPLREVIVGYPLLRLTNKFPRLVHKWLRFPAAYRALFEWWLTEHPGKTLEEISQLPDVPDPRIRELYTSQVSQVNALINLLLDKGIVVHQIPPLRSDEQDFLANLDGNACQLFPRDPILVVGNSYFELPLMLPYRRRERFPIRRAVKERIQARHAAIRAAPEPFPLRGNANGFGPSAFLEGGDVLVFDKKILVGLSGNASNKAGIAWLREQLGPDYTIEPVPLKPQFLHLDVALCTPRPGLAIVCDSAFLDGRPSLLKGWEVINVGEKDALKALACNALVLDEESIVVVDRPSYVAEQLAQAGQTVYPMAFDAITPLGGGFRCWHHPLIRS